MLEMNRYRASLASGKVRLLMVSRYRWLQPRPWRSFALSGAGFFVKRQRLPFVAFPFFRNDVARQKPIAKDAFLPRREIRQFDLIRLLAGWGRQERDDLALFDDFNPPPLGYPVHHVAKGVPELSDVRRLHV
jgi:hypothetical protein